MARTDAEREVLSELWEADGPKEAEARRRRRGGQGEDGQQGLLGMRQQADGRRQVLQDKYSYGLYSYGLYSYGLYSHGLYSDGLYSYGLYSYGPH